MESSIGEEEDEEHKEDSCATTSMEKLDVMIQHMHMNTNVGSAKKQITDNQVV
jgi:hypothetical protein